MRHLKIQQAIPILQDINYNISEVAFKVGYNDPKYFSKCFKKELGITPTEYRELKSCVLRNNRIYDEQLITSLVRIVEDDLSNEFFCIDMFALKLNVSKSTLYRKVRLFTSLSPSQFIQNLRIIKAEKLLSKTDWMISEVAYKVGFNDPKHFSRCFKDKYGLAPSEFQKSQMQCKSRIV